MLPFGKVGRAKAWQQEEANPSEGLRGGAVELPEGGWAAPLARAQQRLHPLLRLRHHL